MLFLDKHLLCFALDAFFPLRHVISILVDDSTYSVFIFSKATYILDFLQIFLCFGDWGEEEKNL